MADAAKNPQAAADKAETPEDYRTAQQKEYGTFVAVATILHNGVPAYNKGVPVPVSNVEKYGYEAEGLVKRVGTKDAQAAAAEAAGPRDDVTAVQPVSLSVPLNR